MTPVLPENIYPDAAVIDALFFQALWLTSIIFVIVLAILVYFMIRYRARAGHTAFYTHGDSRKTMGLTVALSVAVFVGIDLNLAWSDHHAFALMFDKAPTDALVVQVSAERFNWNFRYAGNDGKFDTADDIYTTGDLVVPVDRQVLLKMQSRDVIHSLFLPNVRKKQDVVPGLEVQMWFLSHKTTAEACKDRGDPNFNYEIACAELCGQSHTNMRGQLIIKTAEEFAAWQAETLIKLQEYDRPAMWDKWKTSSAPTAAAANTTTDGEN